MNSESKDTGSGFGDRFIRISMLIVLGWFTLLIKMISMSSSLMLGLIKKLLMREKPGDTKN